MIPKVLLFKKQAALGTINCLRCQHSTSKGRCVCLLSSTRIIDPLNGAVFTCNSNSHITVLQLLYPPTMKLSIPFLFIFASHAESFSPSSSRIPQLARQTKPLFTTSIEATEPNPSSGEEPSEASQEELWQLQLQSEEVKVGKTELTLKLWWYINASHTFIPTTYSPMCFSIYFP
jgi:hypothetical protein